MWFMCFMIAPPPDQIKGVSCEVCREHVGFVLLCREEPVNQFSFIRRFGCNLSWCVCGVPVCESVLGVYGCLCLLCVHVFTCGSVQGVNDVYSSIAWTRCTVQNRVATQQWNVLWRELLGLGCLNKKTDLSPCWQKPHIDIFLSALDW